MVEATVPSIDHWADWSLTRYGFSGNLKSQPTIIYVKVIPELLDLFLHRYLPLLKALTRFVLITGDADTTLPRQVDQRFPDDIGSGLQQRLLKLLDDPRLLQWCDENLDTPLVSLTPIPLGCFNSDGHVLYQQTVREAASIDLRARPLKAYPFVICVGGGGLAPSPKAWTALLAGSIPIIERNPTTAAYGDRAVAYVDSWDAESLDPAWCKPGLRSCIPISRILSGAALCSRPCPWPAGYAGFAPIKLAPEAAPQGRANAAAGAG